jgi:hypothetical protein
MHLPGGFTRVALGGLAHGTHWIDLPTENIPLHLRKIGSKFLVTMPQFSVQISDTPEAIRDICRQVTIQGMDAADSWPDTELPG